MAALSFLRPDFGPPPAEVQPPAPADNQITTGLAAYIRDCYRAAADNRRNLGVDDRMMSAMRALRGEYDAQTLSAIKEFGGSEVYARVTATKVRTCAAMLREIYTATDKSWGLTPTPDPQLAGPSLDEAVREVLYAEVAEVHAATGQPPPPEALKQRASTLRDELLQKRRKVAADALHAREAVIEDVLWEGGFHESLWAFLGDIATFPCATIKGPIVRNKNVLVWEGNRPTTARRAQPSWARCSPFDVYFAPWSQTPQDGYVVHRERTSRSALESMKGLPNYNDAAIDRVLANWGPSSCEWYDYNESELAELEQRESAVSPMYSDKTQRPMAMLSFYGAVSRDLLVAWGVPEAQLPAGIPDASVFAYLVGNEVIGVTMNPHPTGRLPFYTDSFERIPGSCYGNAIPDLLDDVQSVGNAALRAVVNNLAIASGPMGWLNEDRLAENDPNAKKLWPWKMWSFNDPMSSASTSEKPMDFFQPNNNVAELFGVYQQMLNMADELSSIPRYMHGSGAQVGGAGRTASGLSMLMDAANRTIKQTVSSIDTNIIESIVEDVNVYLALTRPDVVMEGDISVKARGAVELMQKETLRMRRLEFLQLTNNPIDQQLVGVEGRFNLLKELARDLGLPTMDTLAISEDQAAAISQAMLQQAMMVAAGGGATGNAPPPGGGNPDAPPNGAPPPAPGAP